MKFYLRLLLLLLSAVLMLSVFVGCDKVEQSDPEDTEDEDDVSSFFPDVEKNNYGLDFNILGLSGLYYYIDEDKNTGSPIDEAVLNRQTKVEKYLGVDILQVQTGGDPLLWRDYGNYIKTAVQNKDGTIDLAMVTTYNASCVSENLIRDFNEIESINLDADYWNKSFMETIEINGNLYIGYGDYSIAPTYVVTFNKEMMALYESTLDKSIYDTVKDMEWTFDKMYEISNLVYIDSTGDGKSEDDIFGLRGRCWQPFRGFLTSANIPTMMMDESGGYVVAINQAKYFEKTDNLVNLLREMRDSRGVYFHYQQPNDTHEVVKGKCLMFLSDTAYIETYLKYNAEFGVLPYPMYDTNQADVGYKSFAGGAYIAIPSYLKNEQMVGETLEMLSFYSTNVRITYYEKLLGKQIADMPDDVAMLDLVWNGFTSDVGDTFIDAMGGDSVGLSYMLAELVKPTCTQNLSSYISSKAPTINSSFRKFVNGAK